MQTERLSDRAAGAAAAPCAGDRRRRRRDPAETLMSRLARLSDGEAMRPLLQDALDELVPRAFTVEACAVDHCKVTPWRDISAALSLTLRSRGSGELVRRIIAATVFATAGAARRQCEEERRAAAGGHCAIAVAPAMDMVVRLFPYDAGLPGLVSATDDRAMTALLAAHLPECRDEGWRIRGIDHEPLQYKPGRLCTLRYTLTLAHRVRRGTTRIEVFGKVYRDDRWQRSYALLHAVWRAAVAGDGGWTAAQPIAAVPAWRLVVQRAVKGRQFRHELADLTGDAGRPDDLRRAGVHLTALARAVRALQHAPVPLGPCLDFATLFAAQRDNLAYLRQVHPPLARELQQLRAAIRRLAASASPPALRFAHGDFAHGNVLVDAGRIGIIDFDRAGQAEPAYDTAYFLTHLASFALRHPERATQVRPLCDHFREAFCALAPEVSPGRLAVYEALDLSAYVLRNFRKRSHQPEWIGWATGQIDAAWERMELAARSAAS